MIPKDRCVWRASSAAFCRAAFAIHRAAGRLAGLPSATRLSVCPPCQAEAQVTLERVIRNSKLTAGLPLVIAAPFQHQPRVSASPLPHRRSVVQRRQQDLRVVAEERRWQIVQLEKWAARQSHGSFDHPFELAHVPRPVVRQKRVGRGCRQRQRPERPMTLQKVVANSMTSSFRWRSGGTCTSTPFNR